MDVWGALDARLDAATYRPKLGDWVEVRRFRERGSRDYTMVSNRRTLFYYRSFVKMTAFGSGLFAGQSVTRTAATVDAMAKHMERMRALYGDALDAEIARLRAALGPDAGR